jgi:PAS domain S-box-containing protein
LKKRSDSLDDWETLRQKISGLGERSFRKSYYPELQRRLADLERFRALLDQSNDAIFLVHVPSGRLVDVNESGSLQLGCTKDELIDKLVYEVAELSTSAQMIALLKGVEGRRAKETITTTLHKCGGAELPVEITARLVNFDGEKYAVAVARDITERQQAQERERLLAEVQRRAAELDTTITAIADGVIIYDEAGWIVRMNPTAERILGYTQEIRRLSLRERMALLRMEGADGKPFPVGQMPSEIALRGETATGTIIVIHRPSDGKTIWNSVSAAPIRAPDGRILGAVSVFSDITNMHQLEEQREDLIRAVSHDLRNPLAVVLGQAQIALRYAEKVDLVRKSAEAIDTSARRMNVMIQDLVDVARMEGGQLRLDKRPTDLISFLYDLLERVKTVMHAERIKIDITQEIPPVAADPDRLERILVNLLSNALKYSPPETEVTLSARRKGDEVIVSVADRGLGIAPQDVSQLFQRYYRAKGARKTEGLGLGLYISRMLVEAHGGHIWVESETGQGSTFHFTLPAA